MPVEKQSVTEEDKEGDRELVAKNLRGEINPQAKEYVTVWEVEAGQGHNCKVVIKKKQSAIWKWDLDDFSHAGWVSLVKGYNRVEVKGKGRICGKREDTTPKVKYYKKKGLSHTAPFPFLSFPKHTRRCRGEFFRTCSHKLFGLRSIVKSVFIPNCFLITLSPFT